MDALKWLLKASLMVALMFLGLKADPKSNDKDKQNAIVSIVDIL